MSRTIAHTVAREKRIVRTTTASAARGNITELLDQAEQGQITVIFRHSRPSAAVVPASSLDAYRLFSRVMREVGETLELSEDPEIVAAVKRAQDDITRGNVIWDDDED